MPSNGSTVVNKTSKFAVFDVKGGEQRSKSASAAVCIAHLDAVVDCYTVVTCSSDSIIIL